MKKNLIDAATFVRDFLVKRFTEEVPPKVMFTRLAIAFAAAIIAGGAMWLPGLNLIREPVGQFVGAPGGTFIWLLKMFIPFIVASSVWLAVSKNSNSVGIALSAFTLYVFTTMIGLFHGAWLGFAVKPGDGVDLGSAKGSATAEQTAEVVTTSGGSFFELLVARIEQPFELPWAEMSILGVIAVLFVKALIFVPFFARWTARLNTMFEIMQEGTMVWMKQWLKVLPFFVFCMVFGMISVKGAAQLFGDLYRLIGAGVVGMLFQQLTLILITALVCMSFSRAFKFEKTFLPAYLIGFSSRSSAVALDTSLECAEKAGISARVRNFSFPAGMTLNMDGTCLWTMLLMFFVLQSETVEVNVTIGMVLTMASVIVGSSVATAAAPGASLSIMTIVSKEVFQIIGHPMPEFEVAQALMLAASIDFFMDMLRTQTNLAGDSKVALWLQRIFEEIEWSKYALPNWIHSRYSTFSEAYLVPAYAWMPKQVIDSQDVHQTPEREPAATDDSKTPTDS